MEDAKTVRYVSKDPVVNLKVRVTLWRLSVQRSQVHLNNKNDDVQVGRYAQHWARVKHRAKLPQLGQQNLHHLSKISGLSYTGSDSGSWSSAIPAASPSTGT